MHSAYRMHELNNAAKDASLSVYFQPGMVHITDRDHRRRELRVVFSELKRASLASRDDKLGVALCLMLYTF